MSGRQPGAAGPDSYPTGYGSPSWYGSPPANTPPSYGPPPGYGYPPGYGPPPPGYGYPPPGYGYPPRRGGNTLLRLVLIGLVIFLLVVGGLIIGLASGLVKPDTLLTLIGQGPAHVEVDNMTDVPVSATLTSLDGDGDRIGTTELGPLDIGTFKAPQPGRFNLALEREDGTPIGVCSMSVAGGDRWQFVVLSLDTLVMRNQQDPARADDIVMSRSEMCR